MTPIRRHRWHIPEREYARHEQRRGRRHAYDAIVPTRTALVVVDMVPFFVDDQPYTRGIVGDVNRLAGRLRAAGGTVAWVVPAAELATDAEFHGTEAAAAYRVSGGSGPLRDRLWPDLVVADHDVIVDKSAPSAFFPGHCDLGPRLQACAVDTVLIAGTVANVCCESTARDARTLGYRVIMVADANAANSDDELNATLRTIYRSFGDVRPTVDVLAMIDGAR